MQLLKRDGTIRELITEWGLMVRIRQGNDSYDRKELFHIPYSKRQYVSSQRFNISGDPCLYLSVYPGSELFANEMLELSWMESGMAKVFHFCLYELQKELVFLHFAKKGSEYLQEYDDSKTDEQKADRLKAMTYAHVHDDICRVDYLLVSKEYRNIGVGRALINSFVEYCKVNQIQV